jgi:hypothetical protein
MRNGVAACLWLPSQTMPNTSSIKGRKRCRLFACSRSPVNVAENPFRNLPLTPPPIPTPTAGITPPSFSSHAHARSCTCQPCIGRCPRRPPPIHPTHLHPLTCSNLQPGTNGGAVQRRAGARAAMQLQVTKAYATSMDMSHLT